MSDRAVNNIYDAIYNENYRLALTLSNKALKKFHNDPAVNVSYNIFNKNNFFNYFFCS